MQEPINCQFELAPQEIVRFQLMHLYTNPAVLLITALGLAQIAFVIVKLAKDGLSAFPDVNLFSWMLIGLILIVPIAAYRGGRRLAANRFVQETRSYTLTAEGMEYVSPSQSARLAWSDFKYWRQSKGMLVFYVNPTCAHLIPVGSFASAAALEQAIAWARAGMPGGGKRRKNWALRILLFLLIFLVTAGVIHFLSTQPADKPPADARSGASLRP